MEDNTELRSIEVRHVLTMVPHWMIRWGNMVFLALIVVALGLSYLIKYPEVVSSETYITTEIPPQKELSNFTGRLDSVYVEDLEIVNRNQILGVLENSANTEDVYFLKSIIDTIDTSDKTIDFPIAEVPILILGEIEMAYAQFENNYMEYVLNRTLQPFQNDSRANIATLNELKIRQTNLMVQYNLNKSEVDIKRKNLNRQKVLLKKGVISQSEYEQNEIELLNAERNLKNLEASISQIRESIVSVDQNFNTTEITKTREEGKLLRTTLQSFNFLKKTILDWENKYVFKSEIDGKVSFLNYWNANQTVTQGDLVFTIIPVEESKYVAKVKAQSNKAGVIQAGQTVNIRLNNYPEMDFGMIKGTVSSISLIPDQEGYYMVNVALPKPLLSTYEKIIPFNHEMTGTADIIINDHRLLIRFFNQLKSSLQR